MTPQINLWLACAKEPFRDDNKDLEAMVNEQKKAILEMGAMIQRVSNCIEKGKTNTATSFDIVFELTGILKDLK